MAFQYRRSPAIVKKIADINPETDIRVRLLGNIVEKTPSGFILDDGSRSEIIVEPDLLENQIFNVGDFVRVFCRVLPLEMGFELRAEIIQHIKDEDIYKKIMEKLK